jgi:hypothetical protein
VKTIEPIAGLQDDLSHSLHSLKIRWIVCLVSALLFGISRLASGGVSLLGILFALIGFIYSIFCLIAQMKILRNLKGVGVRANYWYALMLMGLIFLFFGVAIEVGCFLLYVRRISRRLDKTPAMSGAPPPSDSNEDEWEVDLGEDDNKFITRSTSTKLDGFNESVTLDSDIECQPCLNHFRYHSGGLSLVGFFLRKCEYEYRIDGTKVFVRLLQDFREHLSGKEWDKEWCVRDGVVMELDIRARDAAERNKPHFCGHNYDEDIYEHIASLKRQTEWCELSPMDWIGLKFFILSKHMPPADARRLFRQELERLKLGISLFTKELDKLGVEPDGPRPRALRRMDGRHSPWYDDCKKLLASVSTCGITYEEWLFELRSDKKIVAVLQDLIGQ